MTDYAVKTLAQTIYGEARGESLSGQEAVANVVLNRLAIATQKDGYWWGNSVVEICQKPYQFSCWNQEDANYAKIQKVRDSDIEYQICKRIALRALAGLLTDNTNGATHYHGIYSRPKWSIGKIPCEQIGHHVFYNDIEA